MFDAFVIQLSGFIIHRLMLMVP